ncbi:Response regulator transcription factor [Sulfidibacter corallicola]|uniref:Response regulator transcription factor n=1 Tax=Sulfidibacter corallicola TaxID=2818388 RepID=A0A8A4TTT0_SULCO|nr:response regulator transcription factor [Sulfidibacter corallicola]QTD52518.1 response regulator transcription factor [Sulfidibacter corallicola]
MIRIVVIDDHEVVREGLRSRLNAYDDLELVGEARTGTEGLALIEAKQPDVAILDLVMPGPTSGIDVAKEVKKRQLPTKILIYSFYNKPTMIFGALDAGAMGYQSKSESLEEVIEGCRAVAFSDRWWFSGDIQAIVNARHMQPSRSKLTTKEKEVLRWLSLGYENLNIAARLDISENTVKNHLKSIYRKLEVAGRVGAALWAWRQGLVNDMIWE